MEVNRFRGEIYARFPDASAFSEKLGWSRQKLSNIVNGIREPKLSEVQDMALVMEMDVGEVASFFLHEKSHKCDVSGR